MHGRVLVEGVEDYNSHRKSKRRELVNKCPLIVAWYCAVRLELTLKTVVVPHFGAHSYVGVCEWSPSGGMVHLHCSGNQGLRASMSARKSLIY